MWQGEKGLHHLQRAVFFFTAFSEGTVLFCFLASSLRHLSASEISQNRWQDCLLLCRPHCKSERGPALVNVAQQLPLVVKNFTVPL